MANQPMQFSLRAMAVVFLVIAAEMGIVSRFGVEVTPVLAMFNYLAIAWFARNSARASILVGLLGLVGLALLLMPAVQ